MKQYESLAMLLSDANIIEAMKQLEHLEKANWNSFVVERKSRESIEKPEDRKKDLVQKQKYMLQVKLQNSLNVGRIKNADKFKR